MSVEESKTVGRMFLFRDGHLSVRYFTDRNTCQIFSVSDPSANNDTISEIKYTSEQMSKLSETDMNDAQYANDHHCFDTLSHINLIQQQTEVDNEFSLSYYKPVRYLPDTSQFKSSDQLTISATVDQKSSYSSSSLAFNKCL
jgi:hypothetical protein